MIRRSEGFSLMEAIIVLAIICAVLGFGYFASTGFYKNYALQSEIDSVLSILRRTRSQAINNIGGISHGVYIGSSSYIMFYGNSYATRDQARDELIDRSVGIQIGGLSEIVFSPLSGTSTASGTITITNGIASSSIEINNEGRISRL